MTTINMAALMILRPINQWVEGYPILRQNPYEPSPVNWGFGDEKMHGWSLPQLWNIRDMI